MRALGNVLLVVAAIALVASPITYDARSRGWWKADKRTGWHLMGYMAVMAEVVLFATANFIWELPDWVRPFVWANIAGVAWWRFALVLRAERPSVAYRNREVR